MSNAKNTHIVYQIYPRSFADASGDGVGDIKGIIGKLDYLKELCIDTIWLCPVFASPMKDNGYDISDYRGIAPEFGDMEDLRTLICEAKKRDIGVLLDLVLNHSSNKHKWFLSAIADKNSPYRDYYIFKKGVNGLPPNNWRSNFGGSAWEKDENTDEYYLHVFAKEQPDLNWENPSLRKELFDMIRFYLEMGVAGFRIDAISVIKKDLSFRSLPADAPDGLADPSPCWLVYPGIEQFLGQMREEAFAPYNAYTVAEAYGVKPERLPEFIGENGFFSAVFDFTYTDIDLENGNWFTCHQVPAKEVRKAIFDSQRAVCKVGHGAVYLENHDQNRSPNKYLPKQDIGFAGNSMLGVMYFFLQGTAYIYQGQELGITNYPWQNINQFDDIATKDQYQRAIKSGLSESAALEIVAHRSRDNARTPMMWTNDKNAGFTTGTPWLPVHPQYKSINAASQEQDEKSLLNFYKKMAALRRGEYEELFYTGDFAPIFEDYDEICAYTRTYNGVKIMVVCNFGAGAVRLNLRGKVLLGNYRSKDELLCGESKLLAYEAIVIKTEE